MESALKPFAFVRVRQLLLAEAEYDGWRVNARSPKVGDTGTLVDILQASGAPDRYVVECSTSDGITVWLADFSILGPPPIRISSRFATLYHQSHDAPPL